MKTTLIFGLCLLIVSCTTLKKAEPLKNQIILTKENVSKIDGVYEVVLKNNTAPVSLDLALTFKKYWWLDFERKYNYSVQIKTIDSCHLQTTVFCSNTVIDQKVIKFKIDEGNLLIKRTKFSFYFILNLFGSMKTRLTLLQSNNLVIDHDNFQMVTLVIIPLKGDRAQCERLEFRRH
ncbi:MAG: hypothetical protein IT236_02685 [Bacteroidia bacterium]|nr:hypothetical protein [Bacteroidia bacterium]